jgi:HK97 family phage portal protein
MSLFFKPAGGETRQHWFGYDGQPPGVRVNDESAMRLTSVFSAFRHIVDYVSTLPVDSYRADGPSRRDASMPQLLARQDEPGGPGLISWLGQAAYGLATGNAVGWIQGTDGYGFPTDISWIHWSQWSYDEMSKQWLIFGQAAPSSQIVHIPWMVPPGRRLGLSPIEAQGAVIMAGLSAQEYADVKRGGGVPPSVLKNTQKTVNRDVAIAVSDATAAAFAKGRPFVHGADWDLSLLTIPPNQAQFAETLKMTANQIAAAFGIDPTEVGGTPGGTLTYNTEELRQINRAANMRPYLTRIETGISRYLPSRQYIKLNVDATMRTDIKTRTEVVGAQIADGRMSVNEGRELDDREPVLGGDFYNVPAPNADPTNRGDTP